MWVLDRKICPEDRRLASRGLPSDDKRWSRGTDFFYPILTQIIDSWWYYKLIMVYDAKIGITRHSLKLVFGS